MALHQTLLTCTSTSHSIEIKWCHQFLQRRCALPYTLLVSWKYKSTSQKKEIRENEVIATDEFLDLLGKRKKANGKGRRRSQASQLITTTYVHNQTSMQ